MKRIAVWLLVALFLVTWLVACAAAGYLFSSLLKASAKSASDEPLSTIEYAPYEKLLSLPSEPGVYAFNDHVSEMRCYLLFGRAMALSCFPITEAERAHQSANNANNSMTWPR